MVELALPKNSTMSDGKTWPKPAGAQNIREYRIYRWSPDDGANPTIDTYYIDVDDCGPMVLDALIYIKNKIDPGPAMDKDLYDLPPKELKKIPTVCGSLREALTSLDKDRAFLKAGEVFNDDFIDSYIDLKMADVQRFEMTPHPVEFDMYYSY